MSPAEVELTRQEFLHVARAMFDADDETLKQLYPMVQDLRGLAAHISRIVLAGEETPLSETATGS